MERTHRKADDRNDFDCCTVKSDVFLALFTVADIS